MLQQVCKDIVGHLRLNVHASAALHNFGAKKKKRKSVSKEFSQNISSFTCQKEV